MNLDEVIIKTAVDILRISATRLPRDVRNSMKNIQQKVQGKESAILQIKNIIDDFEIARNESKPICQDTGVVNFMIEVGDEFPIKSRLKELLAEATKRATKEIPLRPNTIDFFDGNSGNNTGIRGHIPIIYFDVVPGDKLKLIAMNKGGGSSNVAKLGMLKPGVGLEGALKFAIDAVAEAGPQGCPPYRLGIGIGGGEDYCMMMAKRALLKPIGQRNQDHRIAKMEEDMIQLCNQLPIGPMGVGQGDTVIDVNIEMAGRHPASLPVGIVISCWALRHGTAIISSDGSVVIEED